jgi:hypothetical protein
LWGVFKLFRNAEDRPLGQKIVVWRESQGPGGRLQPFDPPARVEITDFPGNADLLNPKFFQDFHCPKKAVE